MQAARADGQIAKKQQELQLKLHEQAKISLVSPGPRPLTPTPT